MYTLHIANKNYSSWSLRPWLLMTELGIAFEESLHVFNGTDNWAAFRAFSPAGTVPCLWDGDQRIHDSMGIAEYLAERHPGVWPEDAVARAWARCTSAEMHSGFSALRNICGMNCGLRIVLNDMPPALVKNIQRIDELWCEGLDRFGGKFLAGKAFTAVDAFFAPVAFRIQTYDLAMSETASDYVGRLLALPGMQAWYEAGVNETWRDESHDQEMLKYGRISADLRRT